MKSIFQKHEYGCGVACIAMLCGVSYARAKRICGDQYQRGFGLEEAVIRQAFRIFGRKLQEAQAIPDKGLRALSVDALIWGIILDKDVKTHYDEKFGGEIALDCSKKRLVVEGGFITIPCYDHWAVWDSKQKVLRDPYGYQAGFVPTHFHEVGFVQ